MTRDSDMRQGDTAVLSVVIRHRVVGLMATAQPDSVQGMHLQLLSSRTSLRNDLTAQRDLARELRHRLEFWRHHKQHARVGS